MRLTVILSLAFVLDSVPRPAGACSPAGQDVHQLDPSHAGDTVAPGAVTIDGVQVNRREGESGCFMGCPDGSSITFDPSATDDKTDAFSMGYRLRVVSGEAPRGFYIPENSDFRAGILLPMDYDAPAFTFELEVRAVDLNGNLGPPTVFTIADPGPDDGGGCSTGNSPLVAWSFVIGAIALAGRRRRRTGTTGNLRQA